MEKSTTGKCHNKFWFAILASSIGWLLCYAYFTALKGDNTLFILLSHKASHYHIHTPNNGLHVRDSLRNMKIIKKKKKHASAFTKIPPIKNHKVENVIHDHFPMKTHFSINKKVEVVGPKSMTKLNNSVSVTINKDPCIGSHIYIHKLPSRFNNDMVKNCGSLSHWTNMCNFTTNLGHGPVLEDPRNVFSDNGWFATHQFMLELIFHNKMKKYKCLTNDSSIASAIVPYYAGLDVSRYLWNSNTSMRDAGSLDLVKWLREKPEWEKMWGRDHFMVAGRITWDFRRTKSGWGNQLLMLPEAKNMTVLVIEKSPWNNNDFAIPYPTYFHPSRVKQVLGSKKEHFCSVLLVPLVPVMKIPYVVTFLDSAMLQGTNARWDSYTRRSIFDSILAGCIPVFFHPCSAYVQYLWHLPKDYATYSIFISTKDVQGGKVSIERVLNKIPKVTVRYMRGQVIKLIPRIVYTDPRFRLDVVEDACDVTIKRVLERVDKVRQELKDGVVPSLNVAEELTWKYSLSGTLDEHGWDSFFVRKTG
ncbi:hypothetical protein RJT34_30044 [Clitoria ternatea]|uniref:Exostosin GT47 domain-containing protein n=1 Tax=Clitoria ternatea TaxID=43366 RepID=A0AAN9ETV9_CLITE